MNAVEKNHMYLKFYYNSILMMGKLYLSRASTSRTVLLVVVHNILGKPDYFFHFIIALLFYTAQHNIRILSFVSLALVCNS